MVTRRSGDDGAAPAGPDGATGEGRPLGREAGDRPVDGPAAGPSLTVAAVARRLGVAPATLRTWDRRYGLGASEHLAGSHRRYSATDVARLMVMRRLTLEGVAPSEAARTALSSEQPAAPTVQLPSTAELVDAFADAVPMAADPAALVSAAGHFDNAAVRWMLSRVHPRDVLLWWAELVEPALRTLADRAVLERPGESATPALTAAAFAELRSRAAVPVARSQGGEAGKEAEGARTVLAVATGPGPDLLVHVMATALQGRGVRTRVLSGSRPAAVRAAVERLAPAAVLVDVGTQGAPAVDPAGDAADVVRAAVDGDASVPVFVHRRGATALDLPTVPSVHHVRSLTGALHEVLAVLA